MGLQGALAKLQKNGADLYLQMAEFFTENAVVRAGWTELARDLEHQADTLRTLPAAFWNQLRADEVAIKAAVERCATGARNCTTHSLSGCFAQALAFEEPLILNTYVPLIRILRTGSLTSHGLDFYILVKAHVARLVRMIEPFSSDPAVLQRAHSLLEQFEREVQQPAVDATAVQQVKAPKNRKRVRPAAAEQSKQIHTRAPRPKNISAAKRLVKKLGLPRRQAQR